MKKNEKINLYDEVTNKIIELLKSHLVSNNKQWVSIGSDGRLAYNLSSDKSYQGINQLLLSFACVEKSFAKNAWLTYNQVQMLEGNIKKGEKSTKIYFYNFLFLDAKGKKLDASIYSKFSSKKLKELGVLKKGYLKYFNVFNVYQTENLKAEFYDVTEIMELEEIQKNDRAENLLLNSKADIHFIPGDRASYNCISDRITLPLRNQFNGQEAFYNVALHELTHWTGHTSRLNRSMGNKFGSKEYAYEELIAELGSAFLSAELGFTKVITENASYIQNWISILENDNNFILKASTQANKAATFIKEISKEYITETV